MDLHWLIMDSEREASLWKNGLFVFDTSSIGALYGLIPSSQQVMMEILNKFVDRTWIPGHVLYEYMKNREKMIMNPCKEHYQNPKAIFKSELIADFDRYLADFENEDFHPNMSPGALSKLKEHRETLYNTLNDIKAIIKVEHSKQTNKIREIKDNDGVLKAIKNLPNGTPFMISEIFGMLKEGELRYRNLIPPGYMDKDQKKGTQIYGDLIIWKEILQYASNEKKDVIFICDDIKEDWYICDDKKECFTPRHELLKEFHDTTGQFCWIYPLRSFIDKLEKYHNDKEILPLFKGLDAIKASLDNKERRQRLKLLPSNSILVECDECEHIFEVDLDELVWEWDCVDVDERSMGSENQYSSEDDIECPHCGNDIHLTFNVWEYPMGAYNNSDIEVEGGELESDIDFYDYMPHFGVEEDVCFKCGRHESVGAEGLCSDCQEEQERILASDE